MIPGYGPDCDLCTPDVHYALKCATCDREWDEPSAPDTFLCPGCGAELVVSYEDDVAWKRDVLGLTGTAGAPCEPGPHHG